MSTSAKMAAKHLPFKTAEGFDDVAITIGADAGTTVLVSCQLKDANGRNVAAKRGFLFYLSTLATGLVAPAAPSGGYAIASSKGRIIPIVANIAGYAQSDANGEFAITITEAGAYTCFLNIVKPNGEIVTSTVITFTA